MADNFKVSEAFIEKEVAFFISEGDLNFRIDLVDRVIYSFKKDEAAHLLENFCEQSDKLMAAIHQLTTVLYV